MILHLIWKEQRETRMVWLTIATLGAIIVYLVPPIAELLEAGGAKKYGTSLSAGLSALCIAAGVIVGAMAIASERETGTLPFLDVLTGHREPLWWGKCLSGAPTGLLLGLFLAGALNLSPVAPASSGRAFVTLPILTVVAFCCGLLASAICPTVMTSVLAGVGFYLCTEMIDWSLRSSQLIPFVIFRLLMAVVALILSRLIFLQKDVSTSGTGTAREKSAGPANSHMLQSHLWFIFSTYKPYLIVLAVLATGIGAAGGSASIHHWIWITYMIGLCTGLPVWAGEQRRGSHRFLGNLRLPPNNVWLVRTGFWFLTGLVLIGLYYLSAELHHDISGASAHQLQNEALIHVAHRYFFGLSQIQPAAFLCMWFLSAFAVAQLFSLLCEKVIVSAALSLFFSWALIGMWLPSTIVGGMPLWPTLIAPLILLLVSRLTYWHWASDTVASLRVAGIVGLGSIGITTWICGYFIYRAVEIPNVGPPRGLAAFESSLSSDREPFARIRIILDRAKAHIDQQGPYSAPGAAPGGRAAIPDWSSILLDEGWNAAPANFGPWLSNVAGNWEQELHKAVQATPALTVDPRSDVVERYGFFDHVLPISDILCARALQEQAEAAPNAGLDHLQTMFRLAQHLRHKTTAEATWIGMNVELNALTTLRTWMKTTAPDKNLLQQALTVLNEHADAILPVNEMLLATYLSAWARIEASFEATEQRNDGRQIGGQITRLSLLMPWERIRAQHVLHRSIQRAQAEKKQLREDISSPMGYALAFIPYNWKSRERHALINLHTLRAQIAVALYRIKHNKAPASLNLLTPKLISKVPEDPYSGRPFHYRVSSGEIINKDDRETQLKVHPGQAVIWSVGKDRTNDGGINHLNSSSAVTGTDIIALEPWWK